MKKIIAIAVFGVLTLTAVSCKKDYTCTQTVLGVEQVWDYDGLDKDQAETEKKNCENADGVWASK